MDDSHAPTPPADEAAVAAFIQSWQDIAILPATELATAQSFVRELCELLELPLPTPTAAQDYQFERPVTFSHGDGSTSSGRIDCYRRGAFVLEAKKLTGLRPGRAFDDALLRARSQAEAYACAWTTSPAPRCANACVCCGSTRWRLIHPAPRPALPAPSRACWPRSRAASKVPATRRSRSPGS
jgi:hypothetical protein